MSKTMNVLNGALPQHPCSLCSGTGWQPAPGRAGPCQRCQGRGTPQRNASDRVLKALRGERSLDAVRQILLELSLELPAPGLGAYACGLHDGETGAIAAVWLWLELWAGRQLREEKRTAA